MVSRIDDKAMARQLYHAVKINALSGGGGAAAQRLFALPKRAATPAAEKLRSYFIKPIGFGCRQYLIMRRFTALKCLLC